MRHLLSVFNSQLLVSVTWKHQLNLESRTCSIRTRASMSFSIVNSYIKLRGTLDSRSNEPLPSIETITTTTSTLPMALPRTGLGEQATANHLLEDLVSALNGTKTSSNYYGFVCGGVLPIAEFADNVVSAYDQMVAMHLPTHSISTIVEDRALKMLLELLNLKPEKWKGRTFTTGATGSNILGLACGREFVIGKRLREKGESRSVGELGLVKAMRLAGVKDVQVLVAMGHSSVIKAAGIVGLGRDCVKDVGRKSEPWIVDFDLLEEELKREVEGVLSILSISAGEVNAGKFGTGMETLGMIRTLCDMYGAWLHIDGGKFAPTLSCEVQFLNLRQLSGYLGEVSHKHLNSH